MGELNSRFWHFSFVTLDTSPDFSWTSDVQNLAMRRWQSLLHRTVGGLKCNNNSCHSLWAGSDAQATSKCFVWIISLPLAKFHLKKVLWRDGALKRWCFVIWKALWIYDMIMFHMAEGLIHLIWLCSSLYLKLLVIQSFPKLSYLSI